MTPNNPYSCSKAFGEQLCDAAVRRTAGSTDLAIISIRPSWCQDERNIERNLGPLIRDHSIPQEGLWSYIDICAHLTPLPLLSGASLDPASVLLCRADDLAESIVLSSACEAPGHEVLYIAAADNIGGRDMAAAIKAQYGDSMELRELAREDASGISCAKAKRLIGWEPKRSWRDYLDEQGHAKPSEAEPKI